MAKLTKTTRSVIIAAGVLLVLGVVMMILMLTKPADTEDAGSETSETVSEEESGSIDVTDKEPENVLSLTVSNETGEYTFKRQERIVSTTDEDGNVSSETEYYWTSEEMKGLSPNDSTVTAFVRTMAGLSTKESVEENAEDLEKYGLENPKAEVSVSFDDGSSAKFCFGIQNPAQTNYVYFRSADSRDVHHVSYYSCGSAFYDIRDFVNLTLTESYDSNSAQELDYLVVERKDLEEPVEIRYMFDIAEQSEDEDAIITTFNSHRFVSPITAEVDSTKGQTVCYGVYGLTMQTCAYLEKTEENLAATGLDDPFVTVKFKYGGNERILTLGDQIISVTETEGDTPALTSVTGYYAAIDSAEGIYTISTSAAPWYSFTVQNIMSRRPVSPYIYTVDDIEITTPDGSFTFDVQGNADSHTFLCNGTEVDDMKFRELYQFLITSIGEELYFEETSEAPIVTVRFKYRDEYTEVYGTDEDVLEFYESGDRKSIIRVNGTVLFKVRQVYTDRLIANVQAVIGGGDVELNW